ncbi:MAG TPA: hypothetical protein PKE04_13005, partial [Clostridia bacterium]|nr:hypothetical protein [Clostridia bacterium]
LFGASIGEQDGRTTVVFTTGNSMFIQPHAIGEYTVVIDARGRAVATWSHDDADPAAWRDGDLSSPVWGAPQLEQALSRYEIYRQWHKDHENVHGLPM